jgi:RNA polymerase sigma factor (sigma-70 family)
MTETDTDLAFMIQESHDTRALCELISRHSGIYVDMIRKFGGKSLTQTQMYDLMGEKDYNIYNAALEYNPEKSKFSTFLALRTKYLCLTNKTKNKKNTNIVNFNDQEFYLEDLSDSPHEESSKRELFQKLSKLIDSHPDERVRQIFEERYFSGKNGKLRSWKQISKNVNLSIQGCINVHNRTLPELNKIIENEQITF